MNSLRNLLRHISTWARKPLLACALVGGLMFGVAPAAHAEAWSFSYSGAGINVSGQINAVWSAVDSLWHVTSVEGTHNGDAITGLWAETFATGVWAGQDATRCPSTGVCDRDQDNNYLAGSVFGAPAWCCGTQVDLHIIVAGGSGDEFYSFGYITNYNAPAATEGPSATMDHPDTGRCVVGAAAPNGCTEITQVQFTQVPEINASAGLEAMALLFVIGLIVREMFQRRRSLGLQS